MVLSDFLDLFITILEDLASSPIFILLIQAYLGVMVVKIFFMLLKV